VRAAPALTARVGVSLLLNVINRVIEALILRPHCQPCP
jgi:hypothetical protein